MEISAIVKILIVFMGVLVGSRLKLPLGLALMGGGLGLEIWAGKQSPAILADLAQALSRPELWLLMLNITLILEFGYFMAEESNSNTIITAARRWGGRHGWAFSLILIPATIGLVPMPGGALFSAPMVGQAVKEDSWPSAWKAAVNYWFRHILEYWWPLYPVVIVTLSIFTIESWQFMAVQMPFTLISIAAGYFFLLRNHSQALQFQPAYTTDNSTLFPVLLPILLIVLSTLLLPPLYSLLFPGTTAATSKLLSMLTGLLAGLLLLNSSMKQTDGQRLFRFLFTLKTGNVLLTLGGVMIFQALLETSGLLPQAARQLTETQVPLPVIIGFLPFLAGLVTGIAIGYAGTAFPLIVGLMAVEGTEFTPISTLVLAFTMGYTGMMLSPVHLCFVLTREYFAAPYVKVLLYLMPCVLTVGACGIMLHLLLKIPGW
jgi:integral membrane protein (TIGR00529 family)